MEVFSVVWVSESASSVKDSSFSEIKLSLTMFSTSECWSANSCSLYSLLSDSIDLSVDCSCCVSAVISFSSFSALAPLVNEFVAGWEKLKDWADPEEEIVYVFLSNRVYPDADNKKLLKMNIRTNIQQVIYDAIKQEKNEKTNW